MKIHYIEHKDINKEKWDYCIETACNGRIYAMSWYLDAVADYWDALIVSDYEMVFPLTYRKIFGLKILHQPFLAQQLGIFAQNALSHEIIREFLKAIPKKFLLGELHLNAGNNILSNKKFPVKQGINIELDIRHSIETIKEEYSSSNKRNLKRSYKNNIQIREGANYRRIIDTFRAKKGKEYNLSESCYNTTYNLFEVITKRKQLIVYDAYSEEGTFVAGLVVSPFKNQMIALFLGSSPDSYKIYANHLLFDHAIEKAAQSKEIFDFEGSNTESLAFVYHGFGGKTVPYPIVTISNVPKFIVKVFTLLRNLKRKPSNKKA